MPKILGVDDSATMRKILEMTFAGEAGVEVATVDSGDAAIQWASSNGPDVVLVDASMRGNDGYEVAAQLRGNPATSGAAVILLASQHTPYDAERGRSSGVDDHVLKPFETQSLIDKVKELISKPRAASAAAVRAAPPAPPRPVAPPAPPRPMAPAPVAPAQAKAPARATVAFGAPPGARPPTAAPPSAIGSPRQGPPISTAPRKPTLELADEPAAPVAAPARPAPSPARPAQAAAAATSTHGEMAGKLSGMGLTPEQVDGVLALSREVIERVVWEVVPDLAESIIREEIRRLTAD